VQVAQYASPPVTAQPFVAAAPVQPSFAQAATYAPPPQQYAPPPQQQPLAPPPQAAVAAPVAAAVISPEQLGAREGVRAGLPWACEAA